MVAHVFKAGQRDLCEFKANLVYIVRHICARMHARAHGL